MTVLMKKREREYTLKELDCATIGCNPTNPDFDPYRFWCKINSYITKLHKKQAKRSLAGQIINHYDKIATKVKSKVLKKLVEKVLPDHKS